MNKKFLQSVAAGVVGLSLIASCSHFGHKESNNCGAKNGCASKKESNKCSTNKCSSAKKEAAKDAKVEKKSSKKSKKTTTTTTTEEKTN